MSWLSLAVQLIGSMRDEPQEMHDLYGLLHCFNALLCVDPELGEVLLQDSIETFAFIACIYSSLCSG